jgi:hypothetical protein
MDSMPMHIHFIARRLNKVNERFWTGGESNYSKHGRRFLSAQGGDQGRNSRPKNM